MSRVGHRYRLKVACLQNPIGTVGVCFNDYGDGFQVIFPNGNYDGFSSTHKIPSGQLESEFFLNRVGNEAKVKDYKFKNVLQVEQDFRKGLFFRERSNP